MLFFYSYKKQGFGFAHLRQIYNVFLKSQLGNY